MLQSRTAPSAKTVSTKPASNVRLTKSQTVSVARSVGVLATTLTILTASVAGLLKRKTHVLYARKPGIQSRLRSSDLMW